MDSKLQTPHRARLLAAAVAVAVAVLAPAPAYAQRVTGSIEGRIAQDGLPLGTAKVTATNLTTAAVIDVATAANGGYVLAGLAPGQYLVAVSVPAGEAAEYVEVGTGQSL